jgi:hypothetical protein
MEWLGVKLRLGWRLFGIQERLHIGHSEVLVKFIGNAQAIRTPCTFFVLRDKSETHKVPDLVIGS